MAADFTSLDIASHSAHLLLVKKYPLKVIALLFPQNTYGPLYNGHNFHNGLNIKETSQTLPAA